MDRQMIEQKVDAFIEQNKGAMLAHLKRLIAVRSVEDPSTKSSNAPYGIGVRAALDEALTIARELGLATDECDGHVGWAELPGETEGHLATITHMDVVPEGEGWSGDPYEMREQDGWVIGRGVSDDKGPSVLCLYAAKFFKELNEKQRYGLRVLLGCSEETGMADVDYYLERNPQPLFCFTPDAEFPVCNGEKGHQDGYFASAPLAGNIVEFAGGIANNVVPDRAMCLLKADPSALASTDRVTVSAQDGLTRLDAKGEGGHAAMPAGTINAIGLLVDYMLENGLCTEEENRFLGLMQKLHHGTDGSGVGVACADDVFDPLTCIGGVIEFVDGQLKQYIDIRYPTATTNEKLIATLQAQAQEVGATFTSTRTAPTFYIPGDSAPIQTLLDVYSSVTGKEAKTFTMGGGTYARHFKNAVSYGPEDFSEEKPDFAGPVHGANEGASIERMMRALKIYILALWELQKLEY